MAHLSITPVSQQNPVSADDHPYLHKWETSARSNWRLHELVRLDLRDSTQRWQSSMAVRLRLATFG